LCFDRWVIEFDLNVECKYYVTNVTGRPTGLMSEPLMAPPQLKPSPPLLHKEAPILIKQASLDKNKGGKKDKVCVYTKVGSYS
jgi:hypothetical protein